MGVLIARLLVTAFGFLLAAYLVPGITVASFYIALILAFFWGVINLTVKPIFFILTLPIHFLTFGLFTFVLNGFFLWFLGTFIEGFAVQSFVSAIAGAIVISLTNWLGGKLINAIK